MSEIQGGKIDSHHVKNELDERLEEEKNILEAKEKLNRCERLCEKAVEEYEIDDKECNAKIDSSQNSMEGSKYGEFPETSANNDDEANPNLNVDNIKDDNTKEVVVDTKSNENKEDGKDMPMVNQGENMDELSANAAKLDVKMDNVEVDNVEEDNIKELGTKTNENNGDGKDIPMVNQGENMDELSANEAKPDVKVDNVDVDNTKEFSTKTNENKEDGKDMALVNHWENMDEVSANEAKPDVKPDNVEVDEVEEDNTKEMGTNTNENNGDGKDMPIVNKGENMDELSANEAKPDVKVNNVEEDNTKELGTKTNENNGDGKDMPMVNQGENMDEISANEAKQDLKVDNVKEVETREVNSNSNDNNENGNGMIMLNKVENMDEISANEAKPDLKEHDTKEVNAKSNKNKESEKDMPSVNKKQSLEETTISDSNSKVKEEDTMGHKEAEVKKGSDSLIKTRSVDILVDNNKEINGDRVNENTKEINEDKNDVPFVNKGTNVDDANSGVYVEDNVKDEDTQVQREMSPNVKPPKENINHQKKGN